VPKNAHLVSMELVPNQTKSTHTVRNNMPNAQKSFDIV